MVIVDIKKPKKCIWYEDGQDCKCPLLDDNDCCRGQGNEANSAANDWADLMKGCPIKGVLPEEHGDLVDRDALKEKKVYSHERHEYVVPVAYIDWQDAVIAAERKDDGTTAD